MRSNPPVAEHPRDCEPDARRASSDQRRCTRFDYFRNAKESVTDREPGPRYPGPPLPSCDGGSPAAVLAFWSRVRKPHVSFAPSGGCAAKYRGRLEELSRGFVPAEAQTFSSASLPPTMRPSTSSTTSGRSFSRSTSSRPSSTTPPRSARSRRRTRSTTCSRWAAAAACALDRRVPGELPDETLAAIFARRRREGARGRRDARRRSHAPRRGAEVRARGRRDGAPGRDLAEGGARPGDALF